MRKLKLAVILPIIRFVIAAVLLRPEFGTAATSCVPTSRVIFVGLNAPILVHPSLFAVILNDVGPSPTWPWLPQSIFGFATFDCFLLMQVIVLWYLVGRALDKRRIPKTSGKSGWATSLIAYPLLLVFGGCLFIEGLLFFALIHRGCSFGRVPIILAWIWSSTLIFISVRGLSRAIRLRVSAWWDSGDFV